MNEMFYRQSALAVSYTHLIMIAKSGYNKSYLEMLQEVLVLGIDEYIKKLK